MFDPSCGALGVRESFKRLEEPMHEHVLCFMLLYGVSLGGDLTSFEGTEHMLFVINDFFAVFVSSNIFLLFWMRENWFTIIVPDWVASRRCISVV